MSNPTYKLKKYVLEHRNDKAAFQALMERIDAQPQEQVYGEVSNPNYELKRLISINL